MSDPKKRAEYNSRGFAGVAGFSREDLFGGINFEDLFGGAGFGLSGGLFERFFGHRRPKGPPRGADVELHIELPLEKIAIGGPEKIRFPRTEKCADCAGSGAKAGTKPRMCESCKGSGRSVTSQQRGNVLVQTTTTCSNCKGQGQFIDEPCPKCGGTGRISQELALEVQIPPGIEEGMALRVPGHGELSEAAGGVPGDLYVRVTSASDPRFTRMGADLWHEAQIPVTDAVLGASRKVPTLRNPVTVHIPAGTQAGTILRLRGKGLPEFGGKAHGDLLVRLAVEIPANPTADELKLWRQLRDFQARPSGAQPAAS